MEARYLCVRRLQSLYSRSGTDEIVHRCNGSVSPYVSGNAQAKGSTRRSQSDSEYRYRPAGKMLVQRHTTDVMQYRQVGGLFCPGWNVIMSCNETIHTCWISAEEIVPLLSAFLVWHTDWEYVWISIPWWRRSRFQCRLPVFCYDKYTAKAVPSPSKRGTVRKH